MRWRRRKIHPFKIFLVILLLLFLGSIYGFVILENNLNATILAYGEVKARALAIEIMNNAEFKVVEKINYNDLVYIQTDINGKVVLMQLNSLKINEMISMVINNVQKAFQNDNELEISIPIGQALGSKILASKGPKIKIKIIPVGSVSVIIKDEFLEAGINQTKHRIIMSDSVKVRVVVPLVSSEIDVRSETIIAETIIVGDVPNHYFNLNVGKY